MEEKKENLNESEQPNETSCKEPIEETSVDLNDERAEENETEHKSGAEPENTEGSGLLQAGEESSKPNFIRTAVTAVVILLIFTVSYFAVSMFNKDDSEKPAPSPSPTPKTELKTASPSELPENGQPSDASGAENADGLQQDAANSSDAASPNVKYTQKQAMEIAKDVAKKQFGSDAVVFPASEETPSEVEINGEKRWCYMFGADSMSEFSNSGSMRGLYHFDANTGEIFDNQNGDMKKVN